MSHLALYREFRPKTFDEVIGQNHIVETLKHQIDNDCISHAYLFCGTRGTGKTSSAKIFAKAVNCLNPQNGNPCNQCEVCKSIGQNGNFDIVEIDAASNNRVDEIRDLREKVQFLPSVSKYKVYIIDEVHMLTDSAFNALLKTLEEPPKHIIFILATTEPEKLPATILSRCMRFDFKLVGVDALAKLLENVLTKVGTNFEKKALDLIAKAGNGSVRDTLSVAEMCKAFSNDNITYQSVEECLGLTDEKTLFDIAKAIVQRDAKTIIEQVDKLFVLGKNMRTLLSDICDFFKDVLALKFVPDYDLKIPENVLEYRKNISLLAEEKYLIDILKNLSDDLTKIKSCFNEKVFVEVSLLALFYDENVEIEELKKRLSVLEDMIKNGSQQISAIQTNSEAKQNLAEEIAEKQILQVKKNDIKTDNLSQNIFNEKTTEKQNDFAKVVFGKLIGYIRNKGEMLLLAGFQDVAKVEIQNDDFVFFCKTNDILETIKNNRDLILKYLKDNYNIKDLKVEQYIDKEVEREKKLFDLLDGKLKIKN